MYTLNSPDRCTTIDCNGMPPRPSGSAAGKDVRRAPRRKDGRGRSALPLQHGTQPKLRQFNPMQLMLLFAVGIVIYVGWSVNTSLLQQQDNVLIGDSFLDRDDVQFNEQEDMSETVVLLDGSVLFTGGVLQAEAVWALHALLASLQARGSYRPLVFLFMTDSQAQMIDGQRGVSTEVVQAINDALQENEVRLVEGAENELWTQSAARVLGGKMDLGVPLPTLGTYLWLGTPYVLVQQNVDDWWKFISSPGGEYDTLDDTDYLVLMRASGTDSAMCGGKASVEKAVECLACVDNYSPKDGFLTRASSQREVEPSDLLNRPCISGDVAVATSLAAAREFTRRTSTNVFFRSGECTSQALAGVNHFMATCSAAIMQATDVRVPTVITQDVKSTETMAVFVGDTDGLSIKDGSVLVEGVKGMPWVVVGYNENEDLHEYIGTLYPLHSDLSGGSAEAAHNHGHKHQGEPPASSHEHGDGHDGSGGDDAEHKNEHRGHVEGLSEALKVAKSHGDDVGAVERWAEAARKEVEGLPKPECPSTLSHPNYGALTIVHNPRDIATVHLAGVEDLHRYHSLAEYPKYVLPDGDDGQVCPLWPDSAFCNDGTMAKHTCHWKRFVQATDCAFIDDGSIHPDIPGLVYDSQHWYPDHAQKEGGPSGGNSGKTLHQFDELGNGLSVYGGAVAHFWIEVLPQLLHLNAVLPAHVKILVDDGNKHVQKIIEHMYEKKILPPNRIESWKGKGHIYAAKRVYHGAEMAMPPGTTHAEGEVSNVKSEIPPEFKYIAIEFCFWKNALPLHLVRSYFTPHFRPASDRRDIVILHRKDAGSRKVRNHDEVAAALRAAFADRSVVELVISDHTVAKVVDIMSKAGLFIAPHGAGLVNMMFLAEGSPVIEFAYKGSGGMKWPADYFYPSGVNLGLRYGIVLTDGDYGSEMTAPPDKVVSLAKKLLAES